MDIDQVMTLDRDKHMNRQKVFGATSSPDLCIPQNAYSLAAE
jgi:hypothetical protein